MCKADYITQLSKLFQGCGILPEFLAGLIGNGVDDEVRMDMRRIAVGGNLNLMAGPGPFCKLFCDFMSLHRGQLLPWGEGLNVLIEIDAVQLPVSSFGRKEFCDGVPAVAVDTADQVPLGLLIPSLFRLHAVAHHRFHGTDCLRPLLNIRHGRHRSRPPMRQSCS